MDDNKAGSQRLFGGQCVQYHAFLPSRDTNVKKKKKKDSLTMCHSASVTQKKFKQVKVKPTKKMRHCGSQCGGRKKKKQRQAECVNALGCMCVYMYNCG